MTDLLQRADPAREAIANSERIRVKVDERLGVSAPLRDTGRRRARPWLVAAAAFLAVLLVALPFLLPNQPSVYEPSLEGIAAMPGIETVTPLASGGLQTMAVDGGDVWVMTMLQNQLQRVDAATGDIEASYPIEGHIEGVVAGDGNLWLMNYENGGEALRFDPQAGAVDLAVPLGGAPGPAHWFGDALWVSNDQGQLLQISPAGEILSTRPGELKGGEGLGYLWVNDPSTGLISSLDQQGNLGELVVPTTGAVPGTMAGAGVRQVTEADGKLWLLDGDYPFGTNVSVFDPSTGDLSPFAGLTFGLLDMIEWDGFLWVTSHTDFLLLRVDPITAEVARYPMPGKIGGLATTGDGLWATLYHPGALIRLDPDDLSQAAPITTDDWNRFPHRLLCTGESQPGEPTILLEPYGWLDYGSWSVIQARLSDEGYQVCSHGFVDGEASPQQRADAAEAAIDEAGISGPFVLLATGDGVHASRLFADGRDDLAGVVLVDPLPVGFQSLVEQQLDQPGQPPWPDIDPATSAALDDFGDLPLTVIGQDPEAVFLSEGFVDAYGPETANALNDAWQRGLDFYAGLSTDARSRVADDTGLHMVVWDQPDLVVEEVLGVIGSS
jgi:streptogramin lyase